MIRKMEGAEITAERLDMVMKAHERGRLVDQVFSAFPRCPSREDFIPTSPDFYLQLENVKWTVIAGTVGDTLIVGTESRLLEECRRVRSSLLRGHR